MAAKVRVSKLLQEIRGFAEIANRQPPPRSAGMLLAQMRPPLIQAALTRFRLSVTMIQPEGFDIPRPVKISHVNPPPTPAASRPVS